jgi:Resolvase, N terminal domain
LRFSPLSSHPDDYAHAIARRHQGAAIDTTTAAGKLVFGIFAALAEFERELITERTRAMPVEDKTQSNCDLFPAGRKILAFGAARTGQKFFFARRE